MRTKRFLLALLLCCVGLVGSAANSVSDFGWDYVYDSSSNPIGFKVKSYSGSSTDVVIPSEITMWGYTLPVLEIGSSAFENKTITSVVIPNSVTAIDTKAFWNCTSLKTVKLGNSVASIGDLAFQYCHALESISLPNSLTSVGDHFLCCCCSMTTLVIPENLTSIGTYFLHGCQAMRSVYLMGTNARTLGDNPFCSQDQQKKGQVQGCTFYVANEGLIDTYTNADNWKYAAEGNSEYIGDDGHYQNGGTDGTLARNKYAVMPENARTYTNKWATICLPYDVADVKQEFGDNAKVAVLTSAELLSTSTSTTKNYKMHFTIINVDGANEMKANTPYLLKVDPKNIGTGYVIDQGDVPYNTQIETAVTVQNETATKVVMVGKYEYYPLKKGEYLLATASDGSQKIYKTSKDGGNNIKAYRCFWRITDAEGNVYTNAKLGIVDDELTPTAIATVSTEEVAPRRGAAIFTLSGQRADSDWENLPKGVYIQNGKKWIKK